MNANKIESIEDETLGNASDESTTASEPGDGQDSTANTDKRNTMRDFDENTIEPKRDDNFAVGDSPSKPAASNDRPSRSYVETLITGRLKLDDKKKTDLVKNLLCLLEGPLNSKAACDAMIEITQTECSYLAVEGNKELFFKKVFGWEADEAEQLMELYRAGRWADVTITVKADEANGNKSENQNDGTTPKLRQAGGASLPKAQTLDSRAKEHDAVHQPRSTVQPRQSPSGTKEKKRAPTTASNKQGHFGPTKATKTTDVEVAHEPASKLTTDAPVLREVPIAQIDLANAIKTRERLHPEKVAEYGERMKAGDQFPPPELFDVDGVLITIDGMHRRAGAEKAGNTTMLCKVTKGTRADAVRAALSANTTHGLPRGNKDKRRAALIALKELPEHSSRSIADLLRVSHTFVEDLRVELATDSSCSTEKRTGKDGRRRKMPEAKSSSTAATSDNPTDATEEQSEANTESTDRASRHAETESDPQNSLSSAGKSGNISVGENVVSGGNEVLTWERFLQACAIESQDQIEPGTGPTKTQRAPDIAKIDRALSRAMGQVQSIAGKLRKIDQSVFWRKAMIQVAHAYKLERPGFLCSAPNKSPQQIVIAPNNPSALGN